VNPSFAQLSARRKQNDDARDRYDHSKIQPLIESFTLD